MKQRRHLWIISSCLIYGSMAHSLAASDPSVPLTPYWPNKSTAFFGITVGGAALNAPIQARFDTEGVTFIVPQGCINQNNVTVLVPHALDEWQNPSEIVEGPISLVSADGSTTYTTVMPFFAELNQPCTPGSFMNFGAQMTLYPNPQANTSSLPISRLCSPTQACPINTQPSLKGPDGSPRCVGGFFNYYNYPAGFSRGFTLNLSNIQKPSLTVGIPNDTATPLDPNALSYSLPNRSMYLCMGSSTPLASCSGAQYWGTTVSDFTVKIGSVSIPTSQAMIDTGDNIMLLRDDGAGTYTTALRSLLTPCPSDYTFLKGCNCLLSNLPVTVSRPGNSGIFQYNYTTTNLNSTQQQAQQTAVAICPNSAFTGQASTAPFIFPNGVNLGFAFFKSTSAVTYNFDACTVNAIASINNGPVTSSK